jgi:hypothetical protein
VAAIPLSSVIDQTFGGATGAAFIVVVTVTLAFQGWIRFRHEQVRHRRDLLELDHQARAFDAELSERLTSVADSKKPISSAHPRERMRMASSSGAVFEPLEDAVANLQVRLASLDSDADPESVELPRYMPISVYVDSNDPGEFYALRDAVVRLLDAFGFEVVSETEVRHGSIFQRLTAKLSSPATKAELRRQAQLTHLALQQQTLGLAQAEINAMQAQAAAEVNRILEGHDDYVLVVGSLVGVTHRNDDGRRSSMIVELTPDELIAFQRSGNAVHDASIAFNMLAAIRPEEVVRQQPTEEAPDWYRHLPAGDEPIGLPAPEE